MCYKEKIECCIEDNSDRIRDDLSAARDVAHARLATACHLSSTNEIKFSKDISGDSDIYTLKDK